ncbi:MAG: hypothetical protein KDI90_11455 [Alphaproteobacteria bacterium]|nr:hypothetical protein [Alphaproteobacteria bacterium]
MYQQQKPPSEHSGLAVVLGWIGGVPFSVWAWPYVKPFILQFLAAFRPTIGPNFASFLYFIAPIALFWLTFRVIMFVVDEYVIHKFRQHRAMDDFEEWQTVVFKEKRKDDTDWVWVVLGGFFVVLTIISMLSDKA